MGAEVEDPASLDEFGRQTLVLALRALGLEPQDEGGYVHVGCGQVRARCVPLAIKTGAPGFLVNVGLEVATGFDQQSVIRTMTTGAGRSAEEALLQGVQILVEEGLPPVLSPCRSGHPRWSGEVLMTGGNRRARWKAFEGPLHVFGKQKSALRAHLERNPLFSLFCSSPGLGERPASWLKTCFYRLEDGRYAGECTLNHLDWPEGLAMLKSYQWPDLPGYWLFRQFFLITAEPLP